MTHAYQAVARERGGDGAARVSVDRRRVPSGSLDVLGRPVNADSAPADSEAAHAAYVVTTAQQRDLWDLPDLAVSGRAVPVDDARALDVLHEAAANPEMAPALFPGRFPEAVAASHAVAPGASCCDPLRDDVLDLVLRRAVVVDDRRLESSSPRTRQ